MRLRFLPVYVVYLGSLGLSVPSLFSAGFAIQEQSVSGLGNAYAGAAAVAQDASTVYSNPAGMALIEKPQVHIGLHLILPEAEYNDLGSTTLGVPTQGSDATSDEDAYVPNLYYVAPLNDDLVWGLGISAPFGLTTNYDDDWVGRYLALRTELKTVLVNPSLAYRVSDNLSVGGGLDYVKSEAVLSNAIDMGLVFLNQFQAGGVPVTDQTLALAGDIQSNLGTPKYDGSINLEGDGDAWGFNLGALYEVNDDWRFGAHYRSEIDLDLHGDAQFSAGVLEPFLGGAFNDQGGSVDVTLPDTLSLSVFGNLTDRLSVMADVTKTYWSDFQELRIVFEEPSPPATVIPELWNDVNKYSIGASYAFNNTLTGQVGLAYDESPVPSDEYRSPRIPDEDRTWISLGLKKTLTAKMDLHLAYVSILVEDPGIDNSSHSAGQRLYGEIDATVSLLSLGLSKRF